MSRKKSPKAKYRDSQKSSGTSRRSASGPASKRIDRTARPGKNGHFSLRDEAHFTGGHQSSWTIDTKLRHRGMQFVSAGMHSTMEEHEPEELRRGRIEGLAPLSMHAGHDSLSISPLKRSNVSQMAAATLNPTAASMRPQSKSNVSTPPIDARGSSESPSPVPLDIDADEVFIIDTVGDKTAVPQMYRNQPIVRPISPTASDSSDEVVFHGRGNGKARVLDDPVPATDERLNNATTAIPAIAAKPSWDDSTPTDWVHRSKPGLGWSVPKLKKTSAPPTQLLTFRKSEGGSENSDTASAVDDYLDNLRQHNADFLNTTFTQRNLDINLSNDTHFQQHFELLSVSPGKSLSVDLVEEEKGDASTSSNTDDEDKGTEDGELSDTGFSDESGELSNSDLCDEFDVGGDIEANGAFAETMDDETLAMLLSKQEELGIGSDELLLYDDGVDASVSRLARTYAKETPKKSQRSGHYPSATLMADVLDQDPYGGFDIMDFDRPSLRKKKKGRKALDFDISDEELQDSLVTAWENDRDRKKERKLEREELRAQGLLGSKSVSNKYGEGMTIWQIGKELEMFLNSDELEKAFPPMDKRRRKMIHEVATEFNIKTKSIGTGNKRFTRLFKTKSTTRYVEHRFVARARKINMGFFPRLDAQPKGKRVAVGGGGGNSAGVRYRDGDIVGGAAPEIGAENRGRAMLEKMGWSSGMALGALDNKGILRPIEHVVKNTKTGLG